MKKLLIRISFLCSSLLAFGQTRMELMKQDQKKYADIVQELEISYKDNDKGKGSGYKQFKRWEYENKFNVDDHGNWITDNKVWQEVAKVEKSSKLKLTSGGWTELGPSSINRTSSWAPGVGRITGIAINPKNNNEIYITSPGGGCWKTTVGGNSWTALTDNLPVLNLMSVAIDPVNTNIVYIGSNAAGLLKSTNSGTSWSQATSGIPSNAIIRRILIDPNSTNIILVATNVGIFRSTNAGSSWQLSTSGSFEDLEFKPGNTTVVYASGSKVFRSTNAGQSFVAVSGIIGTGRTMLAVSPANPNYVYAVQANGDIFGYMYRSTDSGINFSVRISGTTTGNNFFGYNPSGVDTRGQARYDMAICVSPSNAEEVHIGGIITWRSLNGGSSFVATTEWTNPNSRGYTHCDMHALEYVGNTIYTGSDGGIYKSTNRGDDFVELSRGLGIRQFYKIGCSATNSKLVSGGAQDNGTSLLTENGWVDWLGADGMETFIDHKNPSILYGTSQFGTLYKSTSGGLGSSYINLPKPNETGNWVTPFAMDPLNSSVLYVGYSEIYKSTTSGNSWSKISSFGTTSKFDNIAVAPSNSNYVYASKGSTIYRSSNGGVSWTNISTGLSGSIFYISVSYTNPEKVAVVTNSSGKVYISSNGGSTWTSIVRNLPSINPKCITFEPGNQDGLYIGMKIGVFYTNNTMTQWVPFSTGLPNVEISELEIQVASRKIRVGTYGRGLWESPLYSSSTNSLPSVSLTSPVNNSTYAFNTAIPFTANASDLDGSILKVEFFSGAIKLGEKTASPYTISVSNLPVGNHSVFAKATDNSGQTTNSTSISINIIQSTVQQSPFKGVPFIIPGKIEAEDFDLGGEGVAYHDLELGNRGNANYRSDGVDIETCQDAGGGYNIGYIRPGEWVEYSVNVQSAGLYNMELRVATLVSGKSIQLDLGGKLLGGTIAVPNTGGWQTYRTVSVANLPLNVGVQILKVIAVTDDVNLNYISFTQVSTPNQAPSVSITNPLNNSIFNAPATINITANATDSDGNVAKVEFFNGGQKIGESLTIPYSFSYVNVATGTYSIYAKATDNLGASSMSSSVTGTVNASTNSCSDIPMYIENNNYTAGSKVKNTGAQFTCKDFPFAGWCNGAAWAYAPGTGVYWQDAWIFNGNCEPSVTLMQNLEVSITNNPLKEGESVIHYTISSDQENEQWITVMDAKGNLVFNTLVRLKSGSEQFELKLEECQSGLYFLKVGSVVKKILKE